MKLPLAERATVRRWVVGTARAHHRHFAKMMLAFVTATLMGLVGPQLLGMLVEAVVSDAPVSRVDVLALVFLAALVVQAVLARVARFQATLLGEQLLARSREEFVEHALRLPLGTVEAAGTGDLLSRSTSDVDRLDRTVRDAVPEIITALILLVLTVIAMVATSPLLACGLLAAVPLLVLTTRWYYRRVGPVLANVMDRWADVQSSTHESVEGVRTIESLGLARRRIAHNERMLRRAVTTEFQHRRLLTVWLPSLDLAYVLPIVAVLLIGGGAYRAGWVELGTVTTLVLYAQSLSSPLDSLLEWTEELQVGNAALRRILGVGELPAAPRDSGAEIPRDTGERHDLTVREARFAYRQGHEVLHGIDLHVPAGQRLVIVGPSGAGKSTLGRLIAGVSPPDSGSVAFGPTEITTFSPERLRREVVLLTQEHHVFACSVRDNLTLSESREGFSDSQLFDALETVGARTWASTLPDGLDTVLGQGGHATPAAVAQQLALARVVLADPHALVLDEATSLLDNAASRDLERSLATLLAGRTVIAIAHRLHAARDADLIAVMEAGRIVELGRHEELLAAQGSYACLRRASLSSS